MTIDEQLRIVAANPRIPTPSAVVLQVLDKARQSDCSLTELARLLNTDAGLCVKILKTINSAMFGLPRPVLSVQRALGVIGLNATRAMVLSLSLPEMNHGVQAGEQLRRYWKRSLSCAVIARELSKRLKRADPEEDLAAALLCDLGTIILQQAMPKEFARVLSSSGKATGNELCAFERQHCVVDHTQVSAHILRGWRFPDEFVDAIRFHHAPAAASTPATVRRAYLLCLASRLADLLTDGAAPDLYRDILKLAEEQFAMNETDLQEFLAPLQPKMEEFAKIMSVDVGNWGDCAAIVAQAADELIALTLSANQESVRAQGEKAQAQEEAKRWRDEAVFDQLTGLYNRRFFLERVHEEFARCRRTGHGLGVLFIDLDGFKALNDRFGHAFGDRVLQEVAEQLKKRIRIEDVVGRFGGDEFCILAWEMDDARLALFADRISKCICSHVVRSGANEGQVGASIGAVLVYPAKTTLSEDDVIKSADAAMYQAKRLKKSRG